MLTGKRVTASPSSDHPERDAEPSDNICAATLDGSSQRTCCLPRGHDGLHRWRAPTGSEKFEWG
jgi:hypothetical protein